MVGIIQLLKANTSQRLFNGIVALGLVVTIYLTSDYVYYSSNIRVHYKYYGLIIGMILYITQTILNSRLLNYITQVVFILLTAYILYSYVYAFFDENDLIMEKHNGILIKTWATFLKLSCALVIIWITKLIRPNNASIDVTNIKRTSRKKPKK